MKRVYFLTSSHYNPAGMDPAPLCRVWIGQAEDHTKVFGKVYRSFNLPRMLRLANQLAMERGIQMTALSADPHLEEIYTRNAVPGG